MPSEGGRRPAGRGGRVARRRVGGDFKGPDVLRTSHEQRRAHPRLCASAGEMQAPRRPRPPPAHWGPSPFPFTLAVIWVENNELPLCSSLRFRCHGLVFCVKPNLSSAVSFEFRCLRNSENFRAGRDFTVLPAQPPIIREAL